MIDHVQSVRDRVPFFWLASALISTVACSDPGSSPPGAQGGSGGVAAGSGGSSAGQSAAGQSAAGQSGSATAGSGGTASAGASTTGGSGGSGGSGGAGGSGGDAGGTAGGTAGGGGSAAGAPGDIAPWRPLQVTAPKARHEHSFEASDADPAVSFNDNTEKSVFDNRATKLVGKLVLPFGGVGSTAGTLGGQGEFCARRGFHVLAIAAYQDYDILLGDPDFFGDARRQVFDGVQHTTKGKFANISMVPADGVAQRTQKALQYLHQQHPEEDWGYYLQQDGSVRWSDVIFTGMSHGASNAARFAMLVRASRAVSIAGPRDNLCTSLNEGNCGGVVASWFDEEPKTPRDRFFAITGKTDDQHTQHLFAMGQLGYSGTPVEVSGATPPYGGSHRLVAAGGHSEFCGQAAYDAACNYAFDVPVENHAGVQ